MNGVHLTKSSICQLQ